MFQGTYTLLALLCYEIMPPPRQVEKQIGEQRKLSFHGGCLSVAPEMNFNEIAAGCANKLEAKEAYTEALYNSVIEQYNVLKSAIYGYNGHDTSRKNLMSRLMKCPGIINLFLPSRLI